MWCKQTLSYPVCKYLDITNIQATLQFSLTYSALMGLMTALVTVYTYAWIVTWPIASYSDCQPNLHDIECLASQLTVVKSRLGQTTPLHCWGSWIKKRLPSMHSRHLTKILCMPCHVCPKCQAIIHQKRQDIVLRFRELLSRESSDRDSRKTAAARAWASSARAASAPCKYSISKCLSRWTWQFCYHLLSPKFRLLFESKLGSNFKLQFQFMSESRLSKLLGYFPRLTCSWDLNFVPANLIVCCYKLLLLRNSGSRQVQSSYKSGV